jgi:plasmid stabilization system protein ParE
MPYAVLLTKDAARDVNELYDYIALHDSLRKADSP